MVFHGMVYRDVMSWHSVGSCASALFSASICQKFHWEIQWHSLTGRLDGAWKHRDHAHLFTNDRFWATKNCGQSSHMVNKFPMSFFFVFLKRQKNLKKLENIYKRIKKWPQKQLITNLLHHKVRISGDIGTSLTGKRVIMRCLERWRISATNSGNTTAVWAGGGAWTQSGIV